MEEDVSTLLGGFRGAAVRSGQRRQPQEGRLGRPQCVSNDRRGVVTF